MLNVLSFFGKYVGVLPGRERADPVAVRDARRTATWSSDWSRSMIGLRDGPQSAGRIPAAPQTPGARLSAVGSLSGSSLKTVRWPSSSAGARADQQALAVGGHGDARRGRCGRAAGGWCGAPVLKVGEPGRVSMTHTVGAVPTTNRKWPERVGRHLADERVAGQRDVVDRRACSGRRRRRGGRCVSITATEPHAA